MCTDVYACALQRPTAQTHDVDGDDEDDDGDDEGDVDNDEDKESVSARVCMCVFVCVWFCMCVYIPTSLAKIRLKRNVFEFARNCFWRPLQCWKTEGVEFCFPRWPST